MKANILIKVAEEELGCKIESYVKNNFSEPSLKGTCMVLKYRLLEKIMMRFEVPFLGIEDGLNKTFDALRESIKYEHLIAPLLIDKEYSVYLNDKYASPERSFLQVGIKKKRRSTGYMFVGHELVPAYSCYIEGVAVEPICTYVAHLNEIAKENNIMRDYDSSFTDDEWFK